MSSEKNKGGAGKPLWTVEVDYLFEFSGEVITDPAKLPSRSGRTPRRHVPHNTCDDLIEFTDSAINES